MNIIAVLLTLARFLFEVLLLSKIETVTEDFRLKIDFISFYLTLSDFCSYFYCIVLSSMVVDIIYRKTIFYCFYITSWISGLPDYISFISPCPASVLELKFSSVFSTTVPVSGLVPVLQRSVGSSLHLSLVSPVLSTVKHRLPVEPKIRFRVERPSVTFKSHDPSLY